MLLNYNKYKFNLHYLSKCRATGTKGTKIGSHWIIKCMVTKTAYWYTLTLNLSSLVVADCLCVDTTLDNIWHRVSCQNRYMGVSHLSFLSVV